ncbi:MAG: phosphoenolpyruvate--protein phosphotransferase [Ignavibacteria bacterium]|nr:phosphoenolpyruvate--protein phosphotransferase [Ignavibacteria bacterium]
MTNTEQVETTEVILKGIAAAPGIAIGPAYLYSKEVPVVEMKKIPAAELEAEVTRLYNATARSEKELQKIHAFAEQKLGRKNAEIFEAQIMILSDSVLMKAIEGRIRSEGHNAEFVVSDEIGKYRRRMLESSDEYMIERAHDVEDVMNRIIRNIRDQKLFSRLEGESIIVSETLTPADTVIFSRNQVLGYATNLGGISSHAALLSRSLKIPAVVGLRRATELVKTGDQIAVDGYSGTLAINPSKETLTKLRGTAERFRTFEEQLVGLADLPAETLDHKHIELSSNVEFPDELQFVRVQGSVGIGLYRTEGQLIGRGDYPGEDEQYELYKSVADGIYPHSVIFRTFDVGGDKLMPDAVREDNPFLGWRGIRMMLDRQDLFMDHLRALLRASVRKNVRIMYPMVSSIEEIRKARELLTRAKADLKERGQRFDERVKVGVMIEVPSAALLAGEIAAEVDFLSIGTNDLIQYLLAVDRDNSYVAPLYQPFHPAVLRTIKEVIIAGHRKHVWVGMCGEMAGDPVATLLLIGMGIDELSVVPSMVPEIKKIIRSIRVSSARRIAGKVLAMTSAEEVKEYLLSIMKKKLPDIPLQELNDEPQEHS